MVPAVGWPAPPSTRSRLVLPAPLRPTRPTLSRARIVKAASSTTKRPPTSTLTPRTWSTRIQAGSRLGGAQPHSAPTIGAVSTAVPPAPPQPAPRAGSAGDDPRLSGPTARRSTSVGPWVVAGVALAGCVYVGLNDPSDGGAFIPCPFHAATGLWCPGCGMTRAVHHLVTGDVPVGAVVQPAPAGGAAGRGVGMAGMGPTVVPEDRDDVAHLGVAGVGRRSPSPSACSGTCRSTPCRPSRRSTVRRVDASERRSARRRQRFLGVVRPVVALAGGGACRALIARQISCTMIAPMIEPMMPLGRIRMPSPAEQAEEQAAHERADEAHDQRLAPVDPPGGWAR